MPCLVLLSALLTLAARAVAAELEPTCADLAHAPATFGLHLLKLAAPYYDYHFALSHQSIWRALAAAAEAADEPARSELLAVLRLPDAAERRKRHYACASQWEPAPAAPGAAPRRRLMLALDDTLAVNASWARRVQAAGLLDVARAPLAADPLRALDRLGEAVYTPLDNIDVSGNAVFLDTLDYGGAWSLDGDSIERDAPFYDDAGTRVGTVDLIGVRAPARVVAASELNATLAELPLDERYSLLLVAAGRGAELRHAVGALAAPLAAARWAGAAPARVLLPRLALTVQHDNVRGLLERLGVTRLWLGADATRGLSSPPATPSAYMQRVSLRLDAERDDTAPSETDVDDGDFQLFVANKPFFFCLFDHDSHDCHFYGAYSEPIPYSTPNDIDS